MCFTKLYLGFLSFLVFSRSGSEVIVWASFLVCHNGLALNPDKTDAIYSVPHSGLSIFHPSPPLALPSLQFPFQQYQTPRRHLGHHTIRRQLSLLPFQIMLLSYPFSAPHSSVIQRRRLQDDCMLKGQLSSGLCKFCVPRRFSQGCTQTRAYPEHTGQSSNSSTWPNQYLSNSPKAALAAYQLEDQLQGCYTDIQSPWIRRTVISFVENRYRRSKSITTFIGWHSTVGGFFIQTKHWRSRFPTRSSVHLELSAILRAHGSYSVKF